MIAEIQDNVVLYIPNLTGTPKNITGIVIDNDTINF